MSAREKTRPVYTRLPVEVADRLDKVAAEDDRTVANVVRLAVKAYLDRHDDQEASAGKAA